jgi:hypothetical protein
LLLGHFCHEKPPLKYSYAFVGSVLKWSFEIASNKTTPNFQQGIFSGEVLLSPLYARAAEIKDNPVFCR